MGREDRFRTVISGMEPRRIAVVMLLPRTELNGEVSTYLMTPALSIRAGVGIRV
jgi:hypothetical protein